MEQTKTYSICFGQFVVERSGDSSDPARVSLHINDTPKMRLEKYCARLQDLRRTIKNVEERVQTMKKWEKFFEMHIALARQVAKMLNSGLLKTDDEARVLEELLPSEFL